MSEWLLEFFSEEIPARMQKAAQDQLQTLLTQILDQHHLTHTGIHVFSTPRRLGAVIRGLPLTRADMSEEKKGPAITANEKAIEGFMRSNAISDLSSCEQRDTGKGVFYFLTITVPGGPTAALLPALIDQVLRSMTWPKSMRWGHSDFRWPRPLLGILCVFDGKTVDGSFDLGGGQRLDFGNVTSGHRFLSPELFTVTSFADYNSGLERACVILERDVRKERIADQLARTATPLNLGVRADDGLLEEVAGLVEWPHAIAGTFDSDFLGIPAEVIVTTMRGNQKYFALEGAGGILSNHFITIANMIPKDDGSVIRHGNEKVLRARLSDARFFWEQDQKIRLEDRLPKLASVKFHDKLGSMLDKTGRLETLSRALAPVCSANPDQAARAGRLAKADLTTGMVYEFPELQGVMGSYYAAQGGEDQAIAQAIRTHYAPLGPKDHVPSDPVAMCVALADKLDTLIGFFSIDEKPTGSKDPFALRRAALGVIRIILDNGLDSDLSVLLQAAADGYGLSAAPPDLMPFFADRVKYTLKERGVRHDIIDAVLSDHDARFLVRLEGRIQTLATFIETKEGERLLGAINRALSILSLEEKKQPLTLRPINMDLLRLTPERLLADTLSTITPRVTGAIHKQDYQEALAALGALNSTIHGFFDEVRVNDDDPAVRLNRLAILGCVRDLARPVADFTRIQKAA